MLQISVVIAYAGTDVSELISKLEGALASTGISVNYAATIAGLQAELADLRHHVYTSQDLADLDALKAKIRKLDQPTA